MDENLKIMHEKLWNTIDRIAYKSNISVSKLARLSGLDATAFNKSKRFITNKDCKVRLRFLNTETISKVLVYTGLSWKDFVRIMYEDEQGEN